MCKHDIPAGVPFGLHRENRSKYECVATRREPLKRWRYWAWVLKRTIDVAHVITKSSVDLDDLPGAGDSSLPAPVRLQRTLHLLTTEFGHLRPVALWSGAKRRYEIRLSGGRYGAGLAAALTARTLAAVAAGHILLVCAECGDFFLSRVERSGERDAYCDKCGRAAAMRAASKRYYEQHREEVLTRQRRQRRGDDDGQT